MNFFDVNCCLGTPPAETPYNFPDADALLREMDDVGIERAMVAHELARAFPVRGNQRLMRELAGHADRLLPSWMLNPNCMFAAAEAKDTLKQLDDNAVRMVRFPSMPPYAWAMAELLAGLEERRIALYFDLSPGQGLNHQPVPEPIWPALHELAVTRPRLRIVLFARKLSPHYMHVLGLLRSCPNVCLDLSAMQYWRATERLCGSVGPERLLFGSYMPIYHAAQFMIQILYARIPDEAKAKIAFGNLARLVGVTG
ncbi:MAG: amidohydrolase family protein [Lentisphaerae bacterium]|nr:amidohydrolase family protein [Lentisphaerota bacterium]